jgi:hypothetical protein
MSLKQVIRTKILEHYIKAEVNLNEGYQHRINIVKDENDDQLGDSHNILNRWENYFCQLLNVHSVNDVSQREIHTAEPLVPAPSCFKVEIAIEQLKIYKLPDVDQIPAELIQIEGNTLHFEIPKLINSDWSKEDLPQQ